MDVIRALIKESVNTVERLRELMFPMVATLNTVSGHHWAVIGNILPTFPVLTVKTFRCHYVIPYSYDNVMRDSIMQTK